jgi:hypothetical protein
MVLLPLKPELAAARLLGASSNSARQLVLAASLQRVRALSAAEAQQQKPVAELWAVPERKKSVSPSASEELPWEPERPR